MKPITWILLSWLAIFAGNVSAMDGAKQLLLGVLEEPQCSKTKDIRARVMFAYDGTGWHTLTSPDLDVSKQITNQEWTLGFDGKSLGTLMLNDTSQNSPKPSDWYYSRDKLYSYAGNVTPIVNRKKAFGGWCDPPQTRPLVLVSMPNVSDPEHWKPFPVGNDYKQKLYEAFKRAVGNVINCKDPYDNKGELFLYGVEDLNIHNGYRSSSDSALISIGLDLGKYRCDGPSDTSWAPQWFLIRSDQITFIGNEMVLVDAGDYNGDGKSEILFWSSGYNKDGYILYFDNLRQKVEYKWSYH
jgi:hypothetical protein